MKKTIILTLVAAGLLILPVFVSAQPSQMPTGGNVDANFNSVTVTQDGASLLLTRPSAVWGIPTPSGTGYMTIDNTGPSNCDNLSTAAIETNYPCPVVLNSGSFLGGVVAGTFYTGGGFIGSPSARTPGGLTIYTTGGGLTVDTNASGGMTIRDDLGSGGLNIASSTGGIENNSVKTKGWDDFSPVRITDPHGLLVAGAATIQGHLRAPTIGGFGWKGILAQTIAPGNTSVLTRTCPFDGSIAVSCNFRTRSFLGGTCTNWTNTGNPLRLVSLNQTAQWSGYSAGTCTIRLKNEGGYTVCGEIELQCWNPNE